MMSCGGGGGGGSGSGSGGGGAGVATESRMPELYGVVNTSFSKQVIGTSSLPRSITLTSSGTAPVVFSGTTVTGPFRAGGNCQGTLQPGAECTVTITFIPSTFGAVTGTVVLQSNAPRAYTITVEATGGEDAGWTYNQFDPAANFAARCVSPRAGIDPFTGSSWPDQPGRGVDERNWLRSWTHDFYLWYQELPDRDPGLYPSSDEYFKVLKTAARTSRGKDKDQFHFSMRTSDWQSLAQTGMSAGYGATFVMISDAPPRNVVVAYTEPGTPAASAPASLQRGARVQSVDGVDINITTAAGLAVLDAGLFPSAAGQVHRFSVLDPGASSPREVTLTSEVLASAPVQNVKTINSPSGLVGYMLFNDHLATSEAALVSAFGTLRNAGVGDLVLDIRYNGGGYLAIASEVAYMIAGPVRTSGRTFERQRFNDRYPTSNPLTGLPQVPMPFLSVAQGFSVAGGTVLPTLNLPRVFVLTGLDTCSASESIINGLRGVDVEVIQIGSTTCGKSYGFYPADNCGVTYFSIQFEGVNAKGFGDYSDGFSPVNTISAAGVTLPGCSVADDFTRPLGDPAEGRLSAALNYRNLSTCPAVATGFTQTKPLSAGQESYSPPHGDGRTLKSPWQQNRIMVRPPDGVPLRR